ETSSTAPVFLEFLDETLGLADSEITPGGMGIITGTRLAFNKDDVEEGLFFIDSTGAETKVQNFGRAKPSEIIFTIPSTLSTGDYTVELRSKAKTKELRTGSMKGLLVS